MNILIETQFELIRNIRDRKQFVHESIPFTSPRLIQEITDQLSINKDASIGVMFCVEWAVYLKFKTFTNITVLTDVFCPATESLCKMFQLKYQYNLKKNMKFDVIVGNPPYNKGLVGKTPFKKIGGYGDFIYACSKLLKQDSSMTMVIPSNFMCLPSAQQFRKWVLENLNIERLEIKDNSKQQLFNIGMSDILILTLSNSRPNNTNIQYIAQEPMIVDLTKYDFWPMYKNKLSQEIFDQVQESKIQDLVVGGGDLEKITLPSNNYIMGNNTRMGPRQNPEPYKSFVKNQVKDIKIPIFIQFDDELETDDYWTWMQTKHYAYVLSHTQTSPKNQPYFFSIIGKHPSYDFDLTTEQQDEIENWYAKFNQ